MTTPDFTPFTTTLSTLFSQTATLPAADLATAAIAATHAFYPTVAAATPDTKPIAVIRQLIDHVWAALIDQVRADGAHNEKLADFVKLYWDGLVASAPQGCRTQDLGRYDDLDWITIDNALGGPCEGGAACTGEHETRDDGVYCTSDRTHSLNGSFEDRRRAWVSYVHFCAVLLARDMVNERGVLHRATLGVFEGETAGGWDYRGSNVLAFEKALGVVGGLFWEQGGSWWEAGKGMGVQGEELEKRWEGFAGVLEGVEGDAEGDAEEDEEVREGAGRARVLLKEIREAYGKK
ncbi:uncharacterized protein H6S33_004904 [Morchella sextelata]|uniref:uncharacterized protein n=1 Tax=Morchella sextelata TaxID=1174677 RepID=UPI001D045AFB|nr:uncharacterized protein H6S33_004904 [Morchella sextelata]KAH0605682.1 hypothetical protein H6S33_004904 [Morchella sextelata]